MYIPTIFVALFIAWMLTDGGKHPISGWLCVVGVIACTVYAPVPALLCLGLVVLITLPILLLIGGMLGAAWAGDMLTLAAKALPDWSILSETRLAGRSIEFCVRHWLTLLLVFFVVFSLIVHTLLPR